ncbi:hypothetical protein STCU_03280 [Strigomonas culicis]|uniref:Uncharacterized protein n=1 Tax=Strigomonas culicis TaxID=28005 RepID=S9W723_9TRYP|nr:hypothetical protein STCU_03465 [Strigomonas culicis]EPY31745.1 hypothetical protein STCU_03280 [Strigomonas culicis]|eukprot:EPY31419.1 hypothetical protein STCU_03465 [Strigomonas culicis]
MFDADSLKKGLRLSLNAGVTAWTWVQERLWPIYSTTIVICVFHMIAVASEKQALADHCLGDVSGAFEKDKDARITEAKKLFNEEVSLAVKERVWALPDRAFKKEYAERHGDL